MMLHPSFTYLPGQKSPAASLGIIPAARIIPAAKMITAARIITAAKIVTPSASAAGAVHFATIAVAARLPVRAACRRTAQGTSRK